MNSNHLKFNSNQLLEKLRNFNPNFQNLDQNNILELIMENLIKLNLIALKISNLASEYDFSAENPGNGLWSFVHVCCAAFDYVLKKVEKWGENLR